MQRRSKAKRESNIITIILTVLFIIFTAALLLGCDDNSTAVTNTQQPVADNMIQIYYHDSLNNPQSYQGPFKNMQYAFEHVFLYRDGYNELKIPVTNVLSINVNPEGR